MTTRSRAFAHIHANGRTATGGVAPRIADCAMVLVHGRGATPESILTLADELDLVADTMRQMTVRRQGEMSGIGTHAW